MTETDMPVPNPPTATSQQALADSNNALAVAMTALAAALSQSGIRSPLRVEVTGNILEHQQ